VLDQPLRPYWLTVLITTPLLLLAGIGYAANYHLPLAAIAPLLAAFLVEIAFYIAAGTPAVRTRLERSLAPPILATLVTASALLPWLIAYAATNFSWRRFGLLLILSAFSAFWYVVVPRKPLFDVAYLGFLAAVYLLKVFNDIYPDPLPRSNSAVLGRLMWIRLGMIAVLSLRRSPGINFGFVPRSIDWKIGIRHYLYFLPPGIVLALWLNFLKPDPLDLSLRTLGLAVATFLGALWVLTAMEEIFFRGLLQQMLSKQLGSALMGLLSASVIFGLAHLPFRPFPNWKLAILAAVAGIFYGRAFDQAKSVRASMVTHALVVTTWRVFLA
jgi:uncharacterized protein